MHFKETRMLSFVRLIILTISALVATAASAQDIYLGTLHYKNKQLMLMRCDASKSIYTLQDKKGEAALAVKKFVSDSTHLQGLWSAQVIGVYAERDGKNQLAVISIEEIQPNKSCHLSDALADFEKRYGK
jgi:hypothetical protein